MSEELPAAAAPAPENARSRRRTTKKVNYAKEQEFSDEDIFEDSPDEDAPSRGRKSRGGGGRRSKGGSSRKSLGNAQEDAGVDETGRVYYNEPGYDPSLPPIRERFPFLPEYEEDGTPKIDLIVGRRPVDEKEEIDADAAEKDDDAEEENDEDDESPKRSRGSRRSKNKKTSPKKKDSANDAGASGPTEYEYLVKFRGRSYLHLEWRRGADLESMNKSAKGIYRRYLKKIAQGTEEDIENPEFDPAYAVPQKIVDEQEQEITVELSDKELLKWEKQREKEIALAAEEDDDEEDGESPSKAISDAGNKTDSKSEEEKKGKQITDVFCHVKCAAMSDFLVLRDLYSIIDQGNEVGEDWEDKEIAYSEIPLEKLQAIINREGPYYPTFEGSDNPYRDGYLKEAPRKPRASYLFFQGTMRGYFQKRNPRSTQAELMTLMGNTWQTMTDTDREPFVELARQESKQYDRERILMEKAQRPNEVWQPLRRCLMVLEHLTTDGFAEIFLEPVDTNEFPDYIDIVDTPMDLRTVRTKLSTKKYQAPEQFARDMRKIWNNCKIYNLHESMIWHVADYMAKQFERLYHAWVLDFRERYLRWADPRARPWEPSCRITDGKCGTPESEMAQCDHCDAMYSIKCLPTPLKKVPSKAWYCPECKPKLKSIKGSRMLSAVAENAARKRAELGDVPKKTIKQTMYLVKWAGLGYEHCTWETRADITDDELIAQYRRLNNRVADDSFISREVVEKLLAETKHVYCDTSKKLSPLSSLKAQLYAQTRCFQFSKFGSRAPVQLATECGPRYSAKSEGDELPLMITSSKVTVAECLSDLTFRVDRGERMDLGRPDSSLPLPMTGEYDAVIPITSKGLLMNVGEIHGSVAFLGYRQFPDGTKGPAERNHLIRSVGDKIIAVDGTSTIGKSFKEVIAMLRESGKNKFACMRFIESKYAVCEGQLASVGSKGRYAVEELRRKFTSDRQRYIVQRVQHKPDDDPLGALPVGADSGMKDDSDAESEEGSEGEFQPESDDEELVVTGKAQEVAPLPSLISTPVKMPEPAGESQTNPVEAAEQTNAASSEDQEKGPSEVETETHAIEEPEPEPDPPKHIVQHENTRSLGLRLLDADLGYSSDEGGDEDCAFFFDGVDGTFMRECDISQNLKPEQSNQKKGMKGSEQELLPAKQSDFLGLGDQAKLVCATSLLRVEPKEEDFDEYPLPPEEEEKIDEIEQSPSPSKVVKRSTVKVEQVSVTTGETVHVWANIEAVAATLQLRLDQLRQVLSGDYDEDLGDEVGGYKWRYAPTGAKVTAGMNHSTGAGGKKAKKAWLEFREKLYDPSEPHPYKNNNRLRDYQVDGVNWLASTWYKKQGCVLADEMGLVRNDGSAGIVCYALHSNYFDSRGKQCKLFASLSICSELKRFVDPILLLSRYQRLSTGVVSSKVGPTWSVAFIMTGKEFGAM